MSNIPAPLSPMDSKSVAPMATARLSKGMKSFHLLLLFLLTLFVSGCQSSAPSTQPPVARNEEQPASWNSGTVEPIYNLEDLSVIPKLIKSVQPHYPLRARAQGVTGTVVVEYIIDEKGKVHNPIIYQTTNPIFDAVALEAVKQWQFEPGQKDGKPVKVRVRQAFPFLLQ